MHMHMHLYMCTGPGKSSGSSGRLGSENPFNVVLTALLAFQNPARRASKFEGTGLPFKGPSRVDII